MLRLAVPALVVLAAEPLYLLVDTAVVGHLGTVSLGGLAVGGGLLFLAVAIRLLRRVRRRRATHGPRLIRERGA